MFPQLAELPGSHVSIRLGIKATAVSLTAFVALLAVKKLQASVIGFYMKNVLRKKVQEKRRKVADQKRKLRLKLEDSSGQLVLVNAKRQEIVSSGIHQLLEKIHSGELSCLEVLHAFQAKALEATEKLNCITEFVAEAEEWAIALDQNPVKGPLHGIPFAVKDVVMLANYDTTSGIAKALNRPAEKDASIVVALKALGAIPLCKTTVSQLCASGASRNPVWGTTKNPFGENRTAGGSSGGDASLIGYGACLFSVGTDLGGSLRIPASYCGAATLKATPLRIPPKESGCPVGLTPMPGIMARDVDTLILVHKLLWDQNHLANHDPVVVPIPWQEKLLQTPRKLRIGYYEQCPTLPVTPGVRRALQMVRRLLLEDGHQVVSFTPPQLEETVNSCAKLQQSDAMRSLDSALQYEEVDPSIHPQYSYGRWIPWMLRPLAASVVHLYSPLKARYLTVFGGRLSYYSYQLWAETNRRYLIKQQLIKKWQDEQLDLCIGPVTNSPAPKFEHIGWFIVLISYTTFYNYVDFPAGSLHVTTENEKDQELLKHYPTSDALLRDVKKSTQGGIGLPIGVQVIGLPFQEEAVLGGMQLIDALLRKDQPVIKETPKPLI